MLEWNAARLRSRDLRSGNNAVVFGEDIICGLRPTASSFDLEPVKDNSGWTLIQSVMNWAEQLQTEMQDEPGPWPANPEAPQAFPRPPERAEPDERRGPQGRSLPAQSHLRARSYLGGLTVCLTMTIISSQLCYAL